MKTRAHSFRVTAETGKWWKFMEQTAQKIYIYNAKYQNMDLCISASHWCNCPKWPVHSNFGELGDQVYLVPLQLLRLAVISAGVNAF